MPRLCSSLLLSLWFGSSLLVLAVTWVSPAHAILIELSDPVFGPGAITLDTDTGFEWLDVPISVGRSFNDVSTQFGPGGDFEGFRYAERDEVAALLFSVGFGCFNGCPPTEENYQPAVFLQGLVGETPEGWPPGSVITVGVTGTVHTDGRHFGTEIYRSDESQTASAEDFEIVMFDDAVGSFGHWLVRPIPEPGTGLLVIAGLLGFVAARRHA